MIATVGRATQASDPGERTPRRTSPRAARRFSGVCGGHKGRTTIQGVFRLTREGI
jgi:hypothetical protein